MALDEDLTRSRPPRAVRWTWASPPDAELRRLAADLVRGAVPSDAEELKRNRARSVWRAPRSAGGVILKHFHVAPRERHLFLLRPSRARREYRVMESFCRLGLPTVRPLAFAERWERGGLREAWFIGRLVQPATTLSERLAAAGPAEREELLAGAMALVAELHRHPFLHRDLHANNVLVDGCGRLLITDLHTVWRVPLLTARMRAANLAQLLFSLRTTIDLDDLGRPVRLYARCRSGHPGPAERWDRLLGRVARALDAFERDHVRGRAARCVRDGSRYARTRLGRARVFLRRGYDLAALAADLDAPGTALSGGAARRVGERVVKSYPARGWAGRLRQRLGHGRARSAWKGACRLEVLGIDTPAGLALVEEPDGSARLVTAAVDGAEPLRAFAERLARDPMPSQRRRLAAALGHLVGRLARAGVRHDDLSTKNILVTSTPAPAHADLRLRCPPGAPRVHVVDLDNLRVTRPFDARALARMLAQLGDLPPAVTRTDRLRFARAYERVAGRGLPRRVVGRAALRTHRRQRRRALAASPAAPSTTPA